MRFLAVWVLLGAFWLALSGKLTTLHLVLGLASTTLVTALAWRLLVGDGPLGRGLGRLGRLALYLPWLLGRIVVANVDVLLRVLGLRPIEPRLVRFRPDLASEFGKVAMANSITLTPGTVTVEIRDDEFIVHALSAEAAAEMGAGEMERRVREVEGRRT